MQIHPVILSGGSGSRLWPVSRELRPKQLLPLLSEWSMLQETMHRVSGLKREEVTVTTPMVVCNKEHRFMVAEQMRQSGIDTPRVMLEPEGRNTAPALTLAALEIAAEDTDGLLLIMPADHAIGDIGAFHDAIETAALMAEQDHIVTFGIVPTAPETGYGYIRRGPQLSDKSFGLDAFVEKPDRATAQQYVASGDYYWNSGMFLLKASVWNEAIKAFRADIHTACIDAHTKARRESDFVWVDEKAFAACPSDSIDYAVMEKIAGNGDSGFSAAVVPLDAQWSDVGAWPALWDIQEKNSAGNVLRGDVFALETTNSLIQSEDRLIATIGLHDMIVVETADAVLVAHKEYAQRVKDVVSWLKSEQREEHFCHRKVYRPWGAFEGIDIGDRYKVKRITVNPGASLSLQLHHHRAEHWIVVRGTAQVTNGDKTYLVSENQSTFIPLGTQHRLENPGTISLEMIEVQSGSYLGEDDIVRFEDNYGR